MFNLLIPGGIAVNLARLERFPRVRVRDLHDGAVGGKVWVWICYLGLLGKMTVHIQIIALLGEV